MKQFPKEYEYFNEFIAKISPHLPEGAGSDFARAAGLYILIDLLVEKGIFNRDEYEIKIKQRLDRIVQELKIPNN